jgi:hypothetical protein
LLHKRSGLLETDINLEEMIPGILSKAAATTMKRVKALAFTRLTT